MALAELLTTFESETEAEVHAIEAAGIADAARIDVEAERARAAQIASAAAPAIAAAQRSNDDRLAEATARARFEVLSARAEMLVRLRAAVQRELAAVVDPRIGAALIGDAVACAGNDSGVLRCSPALAEVARAAAPATLRIEVDASVSTGAIIELASGTQIAATLEVLLDREWPRLACEAITR